MGVQLPPRELELYRRCDEVLHYLWDPIGVRGAPGARDEYYDYLAEVFAVLRDRCGTKRLSKLLSAIERDRMGLTPDSNRANQIANILSQHREWIWEHADSANGGAA